MDPIPDWSSLKISTWCFFLLFFFPDLVFTAAVFFTGGQFAAAFSIVSFYEKQNCTFQLDV